MRGGLSKRAGDSHTSWPTKPRREAEDPLPPRDEQDCRSAYTGLYQKWRKGRGRGRHHQRRPRVRDRSAQVSTHQRRPRPDARPEAPRLELHRQGHHRRQMLMGSARPWDICPLKRWVLSRNPSPSRPLLLFQQTGGSTTIIPERHIPRNRREIPPLNDYEGRDSAFERREALICVQKWNVYAPNRSKVESVCAQPFKNGMSRTK